MPKQIRGIEMNSTVIGSALKNSLNLNYTHTYAAPNSHWSKKLAWSVVNFAQFVISIQAISQLIDGKFGTTLGGVTRALRPNVRGFLGKAPVYDEQGEPSYTKETFKGDGVKETENITYLERDWVVYGKNQVDFSSRMLHLTTLAGLAALTVYSAAIGGSVIGGLAAIKVMSNMAYAQDELLDLNGPDQNHVLQRAKEGPSVQQLEAHIEPTTVFAAIPALNAQYKDGFTVPIAKWKATFLRGPSEVELRDGDFISLLIAGQLGHFDIFAETDPTVLTTREGDSRTQSPESVYQLSRSGPGPVQNLLNTNTTSPYFCNTFAKGGWVQRLMGYQESRYPQI